MSEQSSAAADKAKRDETVSVLLAEAIPDEHRRAASRLNALDGPRILTNAPIGESGRDAAASETPQMRNCVWGGGDVN